MHSDSIRLPARARNVTILGFAVVIAITLALVTLDFARLQSVRNKVQEIVQGHALRSERASELVAGNLALSEAVHGVMEATDSRQREQARIQFRAAEARFEQALDRLRAAGPMAGGDAQVLAEALEAAAEARDTQRRLAQLVFDGQGAEAARVHGEWEETIKDRLGVRVAALQERQRVQLVGAVDRVDREARESLAVTMGLRLGAIAIGMLVAWLVIRYIYTIGDALQRESERAHVALYSIGDGVIVTGAAGEVEDLNPVAEKLTGWSREAARGRPLREVYSIVDEDSRAPVQFEDHGRGLERRGGTLAAGVRLVHREGREFPVEDTASPIRDRAGQIVGNIVVFRDVTHLRTLARRLSWQASHDPLTGLANRREFERRLAEMLDTTRSHGRQHALLFMDLDRFKQVNDDCGHVAGDDLLRQLAVAMHARIRGSDTLARLGGDEFGVLLEACPLEQAIRIANELCETVRDFRFQWRGKSYGVGASVGLVPLGPGTQSVEEAIEAADKSCYAAKARGGNRVHIHR
ncbi:MAG TPA: diguanylate cyclase, partial [Burkholderiales bacterium]|nr:diguanylate cyclase [Burkholderiales bacterium]